MKKCKNENIAISPKSTKSLFFTLEKKLINKYQYIVLPEGKILWGLSLHVIMMSRQNLQKLAMSLKGARL